MTIPFQSLPTPAPAWSWPINIAAYDRTPMLSESERAELERIFTQSHGQVRQPTKRILERLARPIEEVLSYIHAPRDVYFAVIRILFLEMH